MTNVTKVMRSRGVASKEDECDDTQAGHILGRQNIKG